MPCGVRSNNSRMKKSAIDEGNNYVSYFMGLMALGARARLMVNEIVPRVNYIGSQ